MHVMEYGRVARHAAKEAAKGAASGCVTHFLIAVAAAILLVSGAHYWGFSGRTVFVVVLIAIFLASVLIPWEKEKKP
jgi:Mg/Co/Ni transporter MgtE